jgi:hypothetical protein
MLKNKYRIMHGNWRVSSFKNMSGYSPQVKYWWFPFIWFDVNDSIYSTQEDALRVCKLHNTVLKF